jgi:hypothetical protein
LPLNQLRKKKRKLKPNLLPLLQLRPLVQLLPVLQLPKRTLKVTPKPLPLKRTTKSLLTQLQLRSNFQVNDGDDDDSYDDIDIYVAYRRPEIVQGRAQIIDDDEDLPEHIQWKLFLIRQLALAKYRETHG